MEFFRAGYLRKKFALNVFCGERDSAVAAGVKEGVLYLLVLV